MGRALVAAATQSSAASSGYAAFPSSRNDRVATEANVQFPLRVPGIFSALRAYANATGTGRVIKFRKNGADGNLSVSPTDTTAGLYSDLVHTDVVAAGDLINLAYTIGTGTPTFHTIAMVFRAATSHAALFCGATGSNFSTASTTVSHTIFGSMLSTNNDANTQAKIRAPGVASNGSVYVSSNVRVNTTTWFLGLNGSNTAMTMAVGAGLTGLFEDNTHSVTLADGDLVNWRVATGTGTQALQSALHGLVITSTTPKNDVGGSLASLTRAAGAGATFHPILGNLTAGASEAEVKIRHGFKCRTSKLRAYVSANTYSANGTMTLRKNGADATQTFAITAGGTGYFEDASNTDDFADDDDCNFAITGGTSGSISIRVVMLTEQDIGGYVYGNSLDHPTARLVA